MKKPKPIKHGECDGCSRETSLFPFGWIPGWPFVVWSMLCWRCRTAECVSRGSDHCKYGGPAYRLEHSVRGADGGARDRQTYQEWLEATL